jgi:hypothetical protein
VNEWADQVRLLSVLARRAPGGPSKARARRCAGSDLLFLVRANDALAPVTRTSTPAPKEGDTMILPGPAPAVS